MQAIQPNPAVVKQKNPEESHKKDKGTRKQGEN